MAAEETILTIIGTIAVAFLAVVSRIIKHCKCKRKSCCCSIETRDRTNRKNTI